MATRPSTASESGRVHGVGIKQQIAENAVP